MSFPRYPKYMDSGARVALAESAETAREKPLLIFLPELFTLSP